MESLVTNGGFVISQASEEISFWFVIRLVCLSIIPWVIVMIIRRKDLFKIGFYEGGVAQMSDLNNEFLKIHYESKVSVYDEQRLDEAIKFLKEKFYQEYQDQVQIVGHRVSSYDYQSGKPMLTYVVKALPTKEVVLFPYRNE